MKYSEKYAFKKEEYIKELGTRATLLCHKKSGARVLVMENDDENKVFGIGFRTPVSDSTGVPHILEHSVLCGSSKYPVRDPFMFLAKSSPNTFLNAMTFADKTIYPVASCNEKDIKNLMSVYMDAVLFPNIYREKEIFLQEGWHYEMDDPDGELRVNGVVYSEMKGAFSDPESVLERYAQNSLYPDTGYGFESGGDPDTIPKLDYEQFLEFHKKYYHPSNSYIYLYGDMDMTERLNWLDEEYLSKFDKIAVLSHIKKQKPFESLKKSEILYPVKNGEDACGKTWLSLQYSVGNILDNRLYYAMQILEYALIAAEGSPLREALIKSGLGEDVFGGYVSELLCPYFKITLKNTDSEAEKEFLEIVKSTLEETVREGLNKKTLEAAISNMEFRVREADFGGLPKGLFYYMTALESWLYDDNEPVMHLYCDDEFGFFKENIESGYFEELIKKYLLDNTHASLVVMKPCAGLDIEKDRERKELLSGIKEKMSEQERLDIVNAFKALRDYQNAEPTKEALDTLPHLELSDLKKTVTPFCVKKTNESGVDTLLSEINTNGITYLNLLFNINSLGEEELQELCLLREIIGLVDTDSHTYAELTDEINAKMGGLDMSVVSYSDIKNGGFNAYFSISAKFLHDKQKKALELIGEILLTSVFDDEARITEIMKQLRSRTEQKAQGSAHSFASGRALSHEGGEAAFKELVNGISYLRFVERACDRPVSLTIEKLKELTKKVFHRNALTVAVTDDAKGFDSLKKMLPAFAGAFIGKSAENAAKAEFAAVTAENEGFKTTSQVNYVAMSGSFADSEHPFTGKLHVLRAILANEYLWMNLRVHGGAYGAMVSFLRNGSMSLVSYRDPNLSRTLSVYRGIPEYIEHFDISEREMTDYIISVIGAVDTPLSPSLWGAACLNAYLSGVTDEMRQITKDEILSCTVNDIRGLSGYVKKVLDKNNICVIGGSGAIEAESDVFTVTEELL